MKFLILLFAFAATVASQWTECPLFCSSGKECKRVGIDYKCVPKQPCQTCSFGHGCGFERTCRDGCCIDIVPRFPPIRDEGCVFVSCAWNQHCEHGICFDN